MRKPFIPVLVAGVALSTSVAAVAPAMAAPAAARPQFLEAASHYHHRGFYMEGRYGYYNGYRGDRHRHHGWRQYHGYWFPPDAFIGAAIGGIIGGAIAHSR